MKSLMPKTLDGLADALTQATAQSRVIAGGTDLVIQMHQGQTEPDLLIYPGQIPELRAISLEEDRLHIGAMVTMQELTAALQSIPEFCAISDAASKVGTPQIRSKATMAGNLCNASPAGDMLPVGRLYDLELEVFSKDGAVSLFPMEQFILGPRKNILQTGQAVVGMVINRRRWAGYISGFRKIGFREHVSIAREGMGALVKCSPDGVIEDARLTLGAVATAPIRIPEAETLMVGRVLDEHLMKEITAITATTIHNNCRPANRLYKTEAAQGLVADLFALLQKRA